MSKTLKGALIGGGLCVLIIWLSGLYDFDSRGPKAIASLIAIIGLGMIGAFLANLDEMI